MTLAALLSQGEGILRDAGIGETKTDAWYLLSAAADLSRAQYLLRCREELGENDREWTKAYLELVRRRAQRIPLQHLTGTQEFMGFEFVVTPQVLIPRQDTEILVEEALQAAKLLKRPARILDLCTGSGCVAVSLKLLAEQAQVTAGDVSGEALAVAKKNAALLNAQVTFVQSDLFAGIDGVFDIIVSNPPYIPTAEIGMLMPEVRDYEPALALDGGADGLEFYRRIIREAPSYLNREGTLLLEIGCLQAEAVTRLLLESGFSDVQCKKDLAGLDRVVQGRYDK